MEHSSPKSWCPTKTKSCILFLLLSVMHSCSSISARFLGNETDRMALIDIKLQMSDPNGFLNSWNNSRHHCKWPGVICNTRHQRVTNLTLQGKTLFGTISSSIGNLSFIKVVHLGGNNLHGGIPHQIGQLSRLSFVNLSKNLLSEEIPVNLSRCSNLRYINMYHNQLIGKIPVEFGSLTKLEYLNIYMNNLTGSVPASLGNLSSSLIKLALGCNNLEGHIPSEFGSFSRLTYFVLEVNKLAGEIPSSLFNISTLEAFSTPNNFFSGKLPTNIGFNLQNLQYLEIGGNHFSGEIPVSLTNCTNLKILDLADNNFEGKVPPSLGQLLNLQKLVLQGNSLGANIVDVLASLTNCTNLTELSFAETKFFGELSNIGNLSAQLSILYLGGCNLTGTIPAEVENLISLELLSLENNFLTGVIPKSLAKLQNLRVLYLEYNKFSGLIPPALCNNLTNLYDLELDGNNLKGDLGHSLGSCKSLQVLFISGNIFNGSIPSQMFGSYLSPTQLNLSSNSLSGSLPLEVGKLTNLWLLDISNNKFTGHISSTISGCLAIRLIDVHNNQFSGSLPPSLASLKVIEYLDLSKNTLTGQIPDGLNQLAYLKYLNMSYNDLEGEVPIDGIFSNASQIILQGNSKLCGGIPELGLPACAIVHIHRKGKNHLKTILIPLLSTLVISIPLFIYLFLFLRKKSVRLREGMPSTPSEKMLRVSYLDLYRATNEFSSANLIRSGGFGFVYKGNLLVDHGEIKVVAIKVLNLQKRGAIKSFKAECKALSNLRHRNLVPLLTYCSSIDRNGDDFKALVYKYMENGSLDTWLHPDPTLEPPRYLNVVQRLNIAIDVASALDYMHNHSHVAMVHCDVKPSNILLDNDLIAYVGDFGLARLLPQLQEGASSSTLTIKGTIGYAAPEYAMGLEVSTEGDVYSFGILLLEMFTGRRPTDNAFTEGLDLQSFVKMKLSNQVWEIEDPSLHPGEAQQHSVAEAAPSDGNTQEYCLVSVLKIGLKCSQAAAKDRMDMKQVTRDLFIIKDAVRVR